MVPSVPQPGDVVAGKYEVSRLLGKGGMGVVVEALHRKLATRVAIKFLMPDALTTHDGVARFDREARAAALLRSPHVVRVLDVDTTSDGLPFIVMEYLEGHDLGSELRRRKVLPVGEAVDWILEACIGLAEAHAHGIVHRDIKPGNLYLCAEDGRPSVKVMDFGVSKLLGATGEIDLTTTETTVGTPSYMAPEQLLSSKSLDHRVDLWSLGVVLYRMLAGALPFVGDTPTALAIAIATEPPVPLASIAPSVPPDLVAVVMRTLQKDANARFSDAVELGRALERFGTGRVAFRAAVASIRGPLALGRDAPPRAARPEAATLPFTRGAPNVTMPLAAGFAATPSPATATPLANASASASATASGSRSSRTMTIVIASALFVLLAIGGGAATVALRRSTAAASAAARSSSGAPARSGVATEPAGGAFEPPPPSTERAADRDPAPAVTAEPSAAASGAALANHGAPAPRTSGARGASGHGTTVTSGVARPPAATASSGPPADPLHL